MILSMLALMTACSSTPETSTSPYEIVEHEEPADEGQWEEADPDDVEADLDEMPAVPPVAPNLDEGDVEEAEGALNDTGAVQ